MRYTYDELKAIGETKLLPSESNVQVMPEQWKLILSTIAYYENLQGEEFKPPAMTQATTGFLVDEFAMARRRKKAYETYEKLLRTVLESRRTAGDKLVSETVGISPETKTRVGLDTAAIKAEMGFEWVDSHSKATTYEEWRTYKVEE